MYPIFAWSFLAISACSTCLCVYCFLISPTVVTLATANDGVNDKNSSLAVASVTTVAEIKKQYTHRQVEHAEMAGKLQANMGYINENNII